MRVEINLPDDVALYLKENPGAGRVAIAKALGAGQLRAKLYSSISRMMVGIKEEPAGDDDIFSCSVLENLSPDTGGDITVKGRCLKDQFTKDSLVKMAIDKAGIDQKVWKIAKISPGMWHTTMKVRTQVGTSFVDKPIQVTNWRVGLKLVPNSNRTYIEAFEDIVANVKPIQRIEPSYWTPVKKRGALMGLLAPADAHIGKYAWHKETLGGDMDTEIAARHFEDSCQKNLSMMARDRLSQINVVVGHDMLHIENQTGETPHGHHRLDYDTRLALIISRTEQACIRVIDRAVQIAPTRIIWVPGNHDVNASYWLCRVLAQRYRDCPHIELDLGPSMRKMVVWGKVLIGMTHDAEGRKRTPTVNMLAQYEPWKSHWSQARWTELHTGHLHKREVATIGGTIWRRLSALSTIDFWHADNAFVDAVPACESFVYHMDDGVIAEYITMIDYTGETKKIDDVRFAKTDTITDKPKTWRPKVLQYQ